MVNKWNNTIIKSHIGLQNKIYKSDQLLIGGYQRSGIILLNAVFMQSIGPRNIVNK